MIMQAFPGMTPQAVWDLTFAEWVIVAQGADEWAQEMRRRAAER
jgi:hypothetical protein